MKGRLLTAVLICTAVSTLWLYHVDRVGLYRAGGVIALCSIWIGLRMIWAVTSRTEFGSAPDLSVGVVIPVYNEDPGYLRACLESLSSQTLKPDVVYVVDDASDQDFCLITARDWKDQTSIKTFILQASQNRGKRHAQALAFRSAEEHHVVPDIWVTVDSDAILQEDAIEKGLAPFNDPRVQGVAGLLLGRNWSRNLLTRVMDIEFVNSFLVGRAANSKFGAVLVTCGGIAFYRSEVIHENLSDYLGETFMGHPIRAGDDRRLTQYALLRGRVVFAEQSVAYTALPERLSHLYRQRMRWCASFYRGVWWHFCNTPIRTPAYWFVVAQVMEFVFTLAMMVALIVFAVHEPLVIPAYFAYMSILSWVRSIRYLTFKREDMSGKQKFFSVLCAPLVSVIYTFVLTPVRYLSVIKVTEASWGTRQTVEVALMNESRVAA